MRVTQPSLDRCLKTSISGTPPWSFMIGAVRSDCTSPGTTRASAAYFAFHAFRPRPAPACPLLLSRERRRLGLRVIGSRVGRRREGPPAFCQERPFRVEGGDEPRFHPRDASASRHPRVTFLRMHYGQTEHP